jgi:hypothetical protein
MIMKVKFFGIALGILVVVLSLNVSAFAIGSAGSFEVKPGESVEEYVHIMNRGAAASDVIVKVVVKEGEEYMELIEGDEFDVLAGGVASAKIKISVPEGATVGDKYSATLSFSPVSGGISRGGMVDIAFGYEKTFGINVVGEDGQVVFEDEIVEEEVGEVGEESVIDGVLEGPEVVEGGETGERSLFERIVEWFSNLLGG